MIHESLARKFHPAGFEQPEGSRRNYVRPRDELQGAFNRWIGELPRGYFSLSFDEAENQYKKACYLVQALGEITSREANSLLADFKPAHVNRDAGLFVSACYK